MMSITEDIRAFNNQAYDRPRVKEETKSVCIADKVCSLVAIAIAFTGANVVVNFLGDGASIEVVFWATVILFGWLVCAGIARLGKGTWL